MKKPGDTISLNVLREGKQQIFNIIIKPPVEPLISVYKYDKIPSYYIFAGIVFLPLTQPYMESSYMEEYVLKDMPKTAGEQIILISEVLNDDINIGYEGFQDLRVKKVNGVEVENLKHRKLIEECCTEDLRLDLEDDNIIINHENGKNATREILKCYGIPIAISESINIGDYQLGPTK